MPNRTPRQRRSSSRKLRSPAARPELFQEAAAFAARAHRHQVRKDGRTPYISHVMRVALTLTQVFGCDDPVALGAALLHDTIEDTTTDYEDIEERFGADVAKCVAALTKNMALPEDEREDEYDRRMGNAGWRVRLVKLADVYDNYCDIKNWPVEKQAKQRREAKDKCRRAVRLARQDMENPLVAGAIQAVERVIRGGR